MPPYKITYFRGRALAEPIRLVLSYGEVEFEDDPFDFDEWPKVKPNMRFGTVPVMDMDGKTVHQSRAICRYFAKQFGLAGKDDLEALDIDATVDTIHDLREKLAGYHYETHEEAKAQKKKIQRPGSILRQALRRTSGRKWRIFCRRRCHMGRFIFLWNIGLLELYG